MNLNEKLAQIQTQFKSKKSRFNSFGKYYFRSAEDILEATKTFLKELGVSVVINEEFIPNEFVTLLKTTATITDGKETINATAVVGVDLDQKGMQMPQRFGAASSYGKKYALGNLFLIDDTQDSDATNKHGKDKLQDLAKAKSYIQAGGKIDAIKKKYQLTSTQEQELKTLNG